MDYAPKALLIPWEPANRYPQFGHEQLQEEFLLLLQDAVPFHRSFRTVSSWISDFVPYRFIVDKFRLDKGFPHRLWFEAWSQRARFWRSRQSSNGG